MDEAWIGTDFREVDKREPVGRVMGWLRGETATRPVIVDGKKPFGIIDSRKLFGRGIRHDTRIHKLMLPVPVLARDDDEARVAEQFDASLAPYLPVEAQGRQGTHGYVEAATVLDAFDDGPDAAGAAVAVPTLRGEQTLGDAMHAFPATVSTRLPVLDKAGRVDGVLGLWETVLIADFEDQPLGHRDFRGEPIDIRQDPVRGRMVGGWSELPADASFDEVRKRMQDRGYAFVIDGGTYRGALLPAHVLRAARAHARPERPAPRLTPHFTQP